MCQTSAQMDMKFLKSNTSSMIDQTTKFHTICTPIHQVLEKQPKKEKDKILLLLLTNSIVVAENLHPKMQVTNCKPPVQISTNVSDMVRYPRLTIDTLLK